MIKVPELKLLILEFRTLKKIYNLPYFHNSHWYALFRGIFCKYLKEQYNINDYKIWIQSTDTGILQYEENESIFIGITFPHNQEYIEGMQYLLENFNSLQTDIALFRPGKTIYLENVHERINDKIPVLSYKHVQSEINELMNLNDCSLHFYSPLRLKRPKGYKKEGHAFCDEEYFFNASNNLYEIDTLSHLLNNIRLSSDNNNMDCKNLKISPKGLTWLDMIYGYKNKKVKSIGGIVGKIKISGSFNEIIAEKLVLGQYTGIGKNVAFGLGFYMIPELSKNRNIKELSRAKTHLERIINLDSLNKTLYQSRGKSNYSIDEISVDDIKEAGNEYMNNLAKELIENKYKQDKIKKISILKDGKTQRTILIQTTRDKLISKTIATKLEPIISKLLTSSTYAFRKSGIRKKAAVDIQKALKSNYIYGIKANIESYFDSVDLDLLDGILTGLFPFEPLINRIMKCLYENQQKYNTALPRGNPFSPILSNIYLNMFDKEILSNKYMLFRYCDNFIILSKEPEEIEKIKNHIERILKRIGLKIKHKNTKIINEESIIQFLRYTISKEKIKDNNDKIYWDKYFQIIL